MNGADQSAALLPGTRLPETGERNSALDFTKGALVLCMIVYHTLNYFRYDPNLLRHLHFLPPSFIFIAGFLITHLYRPKLHAGGSAVYRRLAVRGLKTLALFILLNVAVQAIFTSSYNRSLGLDSFIDHLDVVFLTGEERAAVFGVLLPISYVLLLSAGLLWLARFVPRMLEVATTGTLVICLVLAHRGELVFNLDLVSMGLLGAVVGFMPRAQLDRIAEYLFLILAAYAAYTVAVRFRYPTYLMNTFGVCLSVLLFYAWGRRCSRPGMLARLVLLLGHYSLLSYLIQIAVLQMLFRVGRHFGWLEGGVLLPLSWVLLPMIATLLLTVAAVKIVVIVRAQLAVADRAYRVVFA